ncbi:MAG: TRAP transporter small permease subunit [Alphaproteobacteria bacterium]|nr:TRAP transporter small permease subunit [Alphaproteobacteria bacterium]
MHSILALCDRIDRTLELIAETCVWAFIGCIVTICFDVVSRKFGYQIPGLGSTRLQEMEWHFHGVLFCTWLGWAYIKNAHVRIDVFTGQLDARRQARLELIGCFLFALPYLFVALPFAHAFFMTSLTQLEGSSAPNGLGWRFLIKGFLYFGFISVAFAVVSVALRRVVFLYGPPEIARRALPKPSAGH